MSSRAIVSVLFGFILVSLLGYTMWASTQQAVWDWDGLTLGMDRWWTLATFIDAYYGFLTFYVWVWFKERGILARAGWFLGIMTMGNMAMAAYVLLQLAKLKKGESAGAIFAVRTNEPY